MARSTNSTGLVIVTTNYGFKARATAQAANAGFSRRKLALNPG
jgi:hypothetical protein